jgi:hypothetical protein
MRNCMIYTCQLSTVRISVGALFENVHLDNKEEVRG